MARAPPLLPALRAGLHTEDLSCGPASAADLMHPHAKFFFEDERIACPPKAHCPTLTLHVDPFKEIELWAKSGTRDWKPGLIWMRSPSIVEPVQLSTDGKTMSWAKGSCGFEIVPKIPSNRSYYDNSSIAYLTGRQLRVRGRYDEKRHIFVCDSIWPVDWHLPVGPLQNTEHISALAYPFLLSAESHRLRMHVRSTTLGVPAGSRVEHSFFQQILWAKELEAEHKARTAPETTDGAESDSKERNDSLSRFAGKAVVAIVLNGAQGDDDEADGGHLAIATGRVGPRGQCSDWIVNNFYPLSFYSEKGILSSPLPLDAYMTDLNAGQCWYRPNYMMVAVLSNDEAAELLQGGFSRAFPQQYRKRFTYHHSTLNCSGICINILRSLGWDIPSRGATSWLQSFAAITVMSVMERSLFGGCKASDYLSEDTTRLFPAAAFEEAGADLLRMAGEGSRAGGGILRRKLASSLEAVIFMRIPQIPSSRKLGTFPIVSLADHFERWPKDPAKRQIIPCPDRPPLPPHLRDADFPHRRPWRRSDVMVFLNAVIFGLLIGFLLSYFAGVPRTAAYGSSFTVALCVTTSLWFMYA